MNKISRTPLNRTTQLWLLSKMNIDTYVCQITKNKKQRTPEFAPVSLSTRRSTRFSASQSGSQPASVCLLGFWFQFQAKLTKANNYHLFLVQIALLAFAFLPDSINKKINSAIKIKIFTLKIIAKDAHPWHTAYNGNCKKTN